MEKRPQGRKYGAPSKRAHHALARGQSLRAGSGEGSIRWPGVILGLALLPFLAATVLTFWQCLAFAAVDHAFWKSAEFWFFHTGVILWLICWVGLRGRWLHLAYVFGHEWTHALATLCCGGRLLRFPVISSSGGHVVTDRSNLFIKLAPYVIPFYTVLAAIGFGFAQLLGPLPEGALWAVYATLGFTWAFHASFTVRMMFVRQPDFQWGGRFFSVIVIGLLNLWLLSLLLVLASPAVTAATFAQIWLEQAIAVGAGVRWAFSGR